MVGGIILAVCHPGPQSIMMIYSGLPTFRQFFLFTLILFYIPACGQKSELETAPAGKPQILLFSPADRTVNFSKDRLNDPSPIFAVFNKDMNPTTARNGIFLRTACNKAVPPKQGSPAYNPDTRTVSFSPLELEANQQYIASISRTTSDFEGTLLEKDTIWRFSTGPVIDLLPPLFDGVLVAVTHNSTEITLQWPLADDKIDNATAQGDLEYLIYRNSGNPIGESCGLAQINLSSPITVAAADACSNSSCSYKVGGLNANTQYCFLVRARDRGCHIDSNQRVVSAPTNPGGRLYVANLGFNSLFVFDNAGQPEIVAPRFIFSDRTRLQRPIGGVLSTHSRGKTLYLANFSGNSVLAFDWNPLNGFPTGDIAPRVFEGTQASLEGPVALAIVEDSTKSDLYVANFNSGVIKRFQGAKDIQQVVTSPINIQIVSSPQGELFVGPVGIAVDKATDTLYVVYRDTNNIAVVDNISTKNSGQIPPNWKISRDGQAQDNTQISRPGGLLLDTERDRLYVANRGIEGDNGRDDSILVFDGLSSRGDPNRSPDWIIKSSAINEPLVLSLTSSSVKRLYVTSTANTVLFKPRMAVFDDIDSLLSISNSQCRAAVITTNPNPPSCTQQTKPCYCTLTPNLVISQDRTQVVNLSGVVAESQGDGRETVYVTGLASINVFENLVIPNNSDTETIIDRKPDKMIAPSVYGPAGIAVDTDLETLYLSSFYNDSISVFENINDAATNGNVPPARRISGTQTLLSGPIGVALVKGVGGDTDRLFVANLLGNNVLEFDLAQCTGPENCDIPPVVIPPVSFNDPNTNNDPNDNLLSPMGIVVDTREENNPMDDHVYVSYRDQQFNDNKGDSIIVFGRDPSEGLVPLRRIRSLNFPLVGPSGMYLDPIRQELYVANRGADQILVFDVDEQEFLKPNICNTATPPVCTLIPIRVISSHEHSTGLFDPFIIGLHGPNGIFLDRKSSPPRLYVSGRGQQAGVLDAEDAILVYNNAETVSGAVIPDRTIGPNQGIFDPIGIFLDPER